MNLSINVTNKNGKNIDLKIDPFKIKKMIFIFNALEEGWNIQKKNDSYVFNKLHEENKEIFLDSYLKNFVENNFDFKKLNDN